MDERSSVRTAPLRDCGLAPHEAASQLSRPSEATSPNLMPRSSNFFGPKCFLGNTAFGSGSTTTSAETTPPTKGAVSRVTSSEFSAPSRSAVLTGEAAGGTVSASDQRDQESIAAARV